MFIKQARTFKDHTEKRDKFIFLDFVTIMLLGGWKQGFEYEIVEFS